MGRPLILLVDEHGVEYLPTLQTYSLDGVQVPDSVVKEWRRRKGHGTTSAVAATTVVAAAGHVQNTKTGGVAASNAEIGRRAPSAAPHGVSVLSHSLQKIKKMVPLDGRGIWLLIHLLSQTKPEDQEELCWSVQEKLRKRKVALIRSKDRLKLECDRRCVFTKAANEIRTASAMTAEVNRCNVLATIVKDHNHATRRSGQKRRQKQRRDRVTSAAPNGTPVSPPTVTEDREEIRSSKSREGPKERTGSRPREESKGRKAQHEKQRPKENRGPRGGILVPLPAPPPPLVLSTKMATAPTSGTIVATSGPASEAAGAGAASASANNIASCDRHRRAGNKPSTDRHGRVSHLSSPSEETRSPTSPGSHGQGKATLLEAGPSVASGKRAGWHQNPRPMGGVRRLGLPPLDERYGESVVDGWVQSPVALRLERPRCKSVDIAHLDRRAYSEYLDRIVGAGVAAAQHRGQKRRSVEEQGVTGGEARNSGDLGVKSIIAQQRRTKAGRSTRFISDPLQKVQDSGHGGHEIAPVSFTSLSPPHLGESSGIGAGAGFSAAVKTYLGKTNRDDDVDTNDSRIGVRIDGSQAIPAPATIDFSRVASIRQLIRGRAGVFSLTSCDAERTQRNMADGGGGEVAINTRRVIPPQDAPCANESISKRLTTDEALTSEALRFRSDGARKVFKQTQRLLEALRTPAESCKVNLRTGARRGCGGGNVGGHSSIVVHHHQNNLHNGPAAAVTGGDKVKRGGGGGGGNGIDESINSAGAALLDDLPDSDVAMWRAPRGDRPARLAEVFRCIAAPHTVHIECEIILHNLLARPGGKRDGDGGGSGGGGGGWDDFVFAWECLADGILAGRALSGHWEHAHHDHGGANSALARSQRAADDLLSDGLMRALLSTRCYRPPGLDQLFVEWLDELLEVVRTYVRRACARIPLQHGLTTGLEWFDEVCNDQSFLRQYHRRRELGIKRSRAEATSYETTKTLS